MERNYTLLMGLLLLLAAVDYCSSFHPKGSLYEEDGFKLADQNPLGENYDGSNILNSVSRVKENEEDQVNYGLLKKRSQMNLSKESNSNEGDQNLQKNGKVPMDGIKNDDENLLANFEAKGIMRDGEIKEGRYEMPKVWESLNFIEGKGKMDGEKEDEQKVYEDALMPQASMLMEEWKEWADGREKEANDHQNIHKGYEGSNEKEANYQNIHKGYEGQNEKGGENLPEVHDDLTIIEAKGKMEPCEKMVDLDFDPKFPVEECDPYLACQNFSMCFRIPGIDAPKLSLEIKSKEIWPFTIKISAPSFLQFDGTEIEIQGKQDKKAKFSIKESGTLIVFRDSSGGGGCDVDIKELASFNLAKAFLN